MKKLFCFLVALCMMIPLTGCGGLFFLFLSAAGDDRADKDAVFAFVCDNEEDLLQAVEAGDFSGFENQGFIKTVDADDKTVDFSCGGAGMGSGTSYVGFYYTQDHDMAAVWCAPSSAKALNPAGEGYEWHEHQGDNYYYTEQICGNFYYYEASF